MPDQVIDYMQRTYVEAVRFDEYLRARDAYSAYGWPYLRMGVSLPWGWRLSSLLGLAALGTVGCEAQR